MTSEKQLLLILKLKSNKTISKQFGVHYSTIKDIIHKLKTLPVTSVSWSGKPIKFNLMSDCAMLRKKQRVTSQTLQAAVCMFNFKVHNSTVRKRLNEYGLFERAEG